ncbi:hypothetical protein Ancab_016600 [Ancistrocladus abbreviatus]
MGSGKVNFIPDENYLVNATSGLINRQEAIAAVTLVDVWFKKGQMDGCHTDRVFLEAAISIGNGRKILVESDSAFAVAIVRSNMGGNAYFSQLNEIWSKHIYQGQDILRPGWADPWDVHGARACLKKLPSRPRDGSRP